MGAVRSGDVPYGRRTPEYDWQAVGKLNWIGGAGIFRANETTTGAERTI
jgi:hypothetical protein